ncbi:[FeFe] hydrogenase H-cluster maturation GTPase HydF [Candidatus Soleaferrea massiliensis]|uniref:[FeFe] hydrogenase H-cluster maturation GTPase HydF n=1 Tax=Candidatus Soleaferrea massiliensis TaxID=1470354 RepID=UPI00058B150E|nr:[FeFe] hydrogenase H-cluster maturation GTPase HydF [Candidatus Soleaferrea massiliensis]
MVSSLNDTPRGERLHIAVFGRTNSGKSTLINTLTGQNLSVVSDVAGTTTDPVYKSMELLPLGPIVLIDTAGLDDESDIGHLRTKKTLDVMDRTDLAVLVVRSDSRTLQREREYLEKLREKDIPVVCVINEIKGQEETSLDFGGLPVIRMDAQDPSKVDELKALMVKNARLDLEEHSLTGNLVKKGDVVVLVAPQDIQAPKGRLILPQVQTIRDLLDNGCKVMTIKTDDLTETLGLLNRKPALVITDSQMFKKVYQTLPDGIPLTSFSILMSKAKGDVRAFVDGAKHISELKPGDTVLIAESCTHHAMKGDIAREKLPGWLEQYAGGKLRFTYSSGHGFPDDLEDCKLIIHCGGCMINQRNMLSKISYAKKRDIPITNFGVAIAFLNDILDKVVY